jgi:hypothetical protein
MKKYKKVISLLFLLSFVFQGFLIKPVKAEDTLNNIILLIDNSGSMRQTDPKRLSMVAASMLIDSIGENTSLNIISFGDKPMYLYSLDKKPSRESLKAELLNVKFDSNYTDAKEGLKEALAQLSKVQGDKSIIILSDGKEDPAGGLTKEHKDEFKTLIEKAHSDGVKINCIALSKAADKDSLENIAFKTAGEFYYSDSPSQLFNVFSKLLGNINDFYTVKEYEIENQAAKEVKLSSYIQEVIIKIAAINNKTPFVDVLKNDKVLTASKLGDGYKIYSFKNEEDNTISISSKDEGKYSVIVQVKSRAKLNINSLDKSFSVPKGVPMDINVSLIVDKDIMGLHMDKVEGDSREPINKNNNGFSFTFNKAKSGQYPILITAYDGQGRIIAVNNLNINVTDYPPFYYTSQVPNEMILNKPYKIALKQIDNQKVINPSGEILVDYGDKYEEFPLKLVDNILVTEVTLHKLQGVKITTCINGVSNNDNFSYYLPNFKVKAIKEPLTKLGYYYEFFKVPIYVILTLSILIFIIITFGKYQYKRYSLYSITKELTYKLSSLGANYFLIITLCPEKNIQYLNLKGNTIEVEDEENNEIGYLILNLPKGNKIMQGIKYFVLKDNAFFIEYYPSMEQQVYKEDEEINTSFLYEEDIRIFIKCKKEGITIYFS